ncbi:MAG: oligosaccharide flippase family protein [Verrucomicrobiota bacterium]
MMDGRGLFRFLYASAGPPALRLGAAFLQFLAAVVVARLLGGEGAGTFFFWSAIVMYLGRVSTLGLDDLSLQQIPRLSKSGSERADFLGKARVIVVAAGLLFAVPVIGYALWRGPSLGENLEWYLALPLGIVGVALCRVQGEAMKGMDHPMLAIVYRQVLAGLGFLIPLLFLVSRLDSEMALVIFGVSFAVAGWAAPFLPGFSKLKPSYLVPSKRVARESLHSGFPMWLSAVFTALNYLVPLMVLEWLQPAEEVSFFTTAYRIFMLVDLLALAVHSIAMPALSRAGGEKDWMVVKRLYRQTIWRGLLVMGLPLIVLVVLAKPIMLMFGPDFEAASPVLRTFLAFSVVSLLMGPAVQLALMIDSTRFMAFSAIARMTVAISLTLLLVNPHGAVALAFATGIALVLQKGLCLGYFWWRARSISADSSEGGGLG